MYFMVFSCDANIKLSREAAPSLFLRFEREFYCGGMKFHCVSTEERCTKCFSYDYLEYFQSQGIHVQLQYISFSNISLFNWYQTEDCVLKSQVWKTKNSILTVEPPQQQIFIFLSLREIDRMNIKYVFFPLHLRLFL